MLVPTGPHHSSKHDFMAMTDIGILRGVAEMRDRGFDDEGDAGTMLW
jgi:hypothetical protein